MKQELLPILRPALNISADCAHWLAPFCDLAKVAPNTVLYYQDDPTDYFYVLVSGHVRLSYINENGMVILLNIVPPGMSFGEVGAIDGSIHADSSYSSGSADVIRIDTKCMATDCAEASQLKRAVSAIVSERFRSHMDLTRSLYLPSLALRLSHVLLRMIDMLGNKVRFDGQLVECLGPIVTQQDLGSMARGTRENVNKTLRGWVKQGFIAIEDRHILIVDRAALEELAFDMG